MKLIKYLLLGILLLPSFVFTQNKKDPYLWLEKIDSPQSMKHFAAEIGG